MSWKFRLHPVCALVAVLSWGGLTVWADVRFDLLGQWGGSSYAVAIVDDIAYLAVGPRVVALDISDPAGPVFLGQSPVLMSWVAELVVRGDYAFVAAGYNGFYVLDISDPYDIRPIARRDVEWHSVDIALAGDYAFVVENLNYGLHIFDISAPENPVPIAVVHEPIARHPTAVAVNGDFVYVATWGPLYIFDISNPRSPRYVTDFPLSGNDLDVQNDHLFVAAYTELAILDVSSPAQPSIAGRWRSPWMARCVSVNGGYAAVSDLDTEIHIVDVSNPNAPSWLGTTYVERSPYKLVATATHVFVSNLWAGLSTIDVTDRTAPRVVGRYDDAVQAQYVTVADDHAYLGGYRPDLLILDVSDPRRPTRVASYPENGSKVTVVGDLAYVPIISPARLDIVDVSNVSNPQALGSVSFDGLALEVALTGNVACVAAHTAGIVLVDVSDPHAPHVLSTLDTGNARGVATKDSLAFVEDAYRGLVVVDIADPRNPVEIAEHATTSIAESITLGGDYAFVGNRNGFDVFDIARPESPQLIGRYDRLPWTPGIDYEYGRVYLAEWLECIDVSDPAAPAQLGYARWTRYSLDLDVHDGIVYLANDHNGLWIFAARLVGDLDCDGAFNGADIDPFFLALADPAAYEALFPDCDILNGDMNADGRLDGADINPFFACLGGNCP